MGKALQIKEKIIEATIKLLQQSSGNIENITIRGIAETVGVGTGLINYHFGSKEKLIEVCVQRIIGNVISVFNPRLHENLNETDKLKEVACQVMDFLISNPEISKISILGDMITPMIMDNTMRTVMGFCKVFISDGQDTKLLVYAFTLILQGAFLRKDITGESLGFDFNQKQDRDKFIQFVVYRIFGGDRL
ncbi:MAG: regulatory protein TetR [Eubacterium sp.]|jgi:AcrR family transcriptional regulator|nr:regulatory protein TetR [Eubacterium sp.]